MSFFDDAERGALTLLLSRNDPLDSCYLTTEGTVLYRVSTQKANLGRGRPDAQVTTVQRFRSRPMPEPRAATSVGLGFGLNSDVMRRRRTRRSRSSQTPSLATISEDTDVTHSSTSSGDEYTNASSGAPLMASGRLDCRTSEEIVSVATIEKRPFSLAPVVLTLHGKEHVAGKYLRKEATFSSSRRFDSLVGESMVWKLSTPTPKLYDSNKNRIAKYCRPFIPDDKGFSCKSATIEVGAGIESDMMLDEIIVTLLLTQML